MFGKEIEIFETYRFYFGITNYNVRYENFMNFFSKFIFRTAEIRYDYEDLCTSTEMFGSFLRNRTRKNLKSTLSFKFSKLVMMWCNHMKDWARKEG